MSTGPPSQAPSEVIEIAPFQQRRIGYHTAIAHGCLIVAGKPVGGGSLSTVASPADPTAKNLPVIPVAVGIVKIHIKEVIDGTCGHIGINTLSPEVEMSKPGDMRQIDTGIQRRLTRIEDGERLRFAQGVGIEQDRVSELRKPVGHGHGRTSASGFLRLNVAALRKRVEKVVQSQWYTVSGEHRSVCELQFQVCRRLKRNAASPKVGLGVDGMNP